MNFLSSGRSQKGFPFFVSFALVFVISFSSSQVAAQFHEVGVGIGGTAYTGDLVRNYDITLNRPALNIFYRSNLSDIVSVKYGLLGGGIHGNDRNPIDAFAEIRDWSFSILLIEGSATLEYHFLDYKRDNSLIKWSPYLFGGLGVFTFFGDGPRNGSYNKMQPVIPFGAGFKYILNPRFNLGVEFGARKTFFDYLDNISVPQSNAKDYLYGNMNDKDWYYYLGFSLSYTFYNIPCPYNYK